MVGVFAYLCVPGHVLGTFFYDAAPPIFRSTVGYAQTDAAQFRREIGNHIRITLIAIGIASAICIPAGVLASRSRLFGSLATNVVGVARGIPSVAILFVTLPWLGLGFRPALVALTILACPPIFVNTATAFTAVDPAVVEAARGMGMSPAQVLLRIESPLALPVVLAGVRTATIEVIASATIAAYIAFPTLGIEIENGIFEFNSTSGQSAIVLGVATIAAIALFAELSLATVQRLATPWRA